MATKKKKPSKYNSLRLASLSVLALVLAVNAYIWWNPSDPLGMISISLSSIAWGVLIALGVIFGVIFWVLMLIDSWRKNKIIWFIFILLGQGLFALLYLLVEKPKIITENLKTLAWIALGLFVLIWIPFSVPDLKNRIHPFDASKLKATGNQVVATVVTKDLKGYKYVGQTTCQEMTEDGKYYLQLTGGKVIVPKDISTYLNFSYSTNSAGGGDGGGGSQSFAGQPVPAQGVNISDLIPGQPEISKSLTSCKIDLWSTN